MGQCEASENFPNVLCEKECWLVG